MEAAIGLIGTVVGACIAGAFMYYKDRQRQDFERERARKALLLDKYEEIFKDLSAYSSHAGEISMQMLSETGYGGKFDPDKLTTSLKENKLKMNVTFYAPELLEELSEIEKKHKSVSSFVTEFILEVEGSAKKEKLTGDAAVAAAELSKIVETTKEKLAGLAKKQIDA